MQTEDKNNEIKVSVLCLAYNHEKYIRKTLEGFLSQKTNFKFEVLIHDDASTDQTASIIAEYTEKYPDLIKPIYQKENQYSQGVKIQQTFNYPRAQGKYFAWCEGDDYWCDDYKLQMQYDVMEEHPECSMCSHKVRCINEDGSLNSRTIPDKRQGINTEGVLSDDKVANAIWLKNKPLPFHTSSFFIRRESLVDLMSGKLDFVEYLNGDLYIVREILWKGHIYFIDKIMSNYRLFSDQSYTTRRSSLPELDQRKIFLKRAKGDLLYDEYTAGRFHKWIIRFVSNRVMSDGAYMPEHFNEILNYLNMQKKEALANCSLPKKLIYYLSVYAHPVYLFLRRIDDSLKNN